MRQGTNRRTRVARSLAGGICVVGLAMGAPAGAIVPEPLVIRVQDAIGAPGEQTAIVFRTYASRPVRRGQLHTLINPALGVVEGTASPIQSYDAGFIFSVAGGVDVTQTITFDSLTQSIDAVFESLSATINAQDGVLGVLYVTLDPTLVPGTQYTIALDPGLTFLNDPENDGVTIQTRPGTLTVRAPTAPVVLSAEGGKVQPGSGAAIEIGTEEPFALQEGRIVITYDPAITNDLPAVTANPHHGSLTSLDVTYPQAGKVQIDFTSFTLEDFNSLPGDLLAVRFGTLPGVPLGFSQIGIVAAESYLLAPGSIPLQVTWGHNPIEFALDPGIFRDGFDTGDTWVWSYLP